MRTSRSATRVDTDWGQIKVLAIDPGAQTVTILHGDDTLVLRVGQVPSRSSVGKHALPSPVGVRYCCGPWLPCVS